MFEKNIHVKLYWNMWNYAKKRGLSLRCVCSHSQQVIICKLGNPAMLLFHSVQIGSWDCWIILMQLQNIGTCRYESKQILTLSIKSWNEHILSQYEHILDRMISSYVTIDAYSIIIHFHIMSIFCAYCDDSLCILWPYSMPLSVCHTLNAVTPSHFQQQK